MTKDEFLNKHCGEFDNKGAWRVFDKETKLSDLNALLRATLIDFAEHEELSSTKYSTYEEWINNYLK
jgi:hypothetical protein